MAIGENFNNTTKPEFSLLHAMQQPLHCSNGTICNFTDLIVQIFEHVSESMDEDRFEIRRMALQIVPQLAKMTCWFKLDICKDIWSDIILNSNSSGSKWSTMLVGKTCVACLRHAYPLSDSGSKLFESSNFTPSSRPVNNVSVKALIENVSNAINMCHP